MSTSTQSYKAFRFRAQKTVGAPATGAASMETLSSHAVDPNAHPMYQKKGEGSTDGSVAEHKVDNNAHAAYYVKRGEITKSLLDYTQAININPVDDSSNYLKDTPTPYIITAYVLYKVLQNLGINDFKPSDYLLASKVVKSTAILDSTANAEEYVPSYKRFTNLLTNFNALVARVDDIPNVYLTITAARSLYATISHSHDTVYSKLGHNHNGVYSEIGHTHNYSDIEGLPDIPSGQSLNQYINQLFDSLADKLKAVGYYSEAKLSNAAEQGFGTTVDTIDLNLYDALANRTFIIYSDSSFKNFPSAISNTAAWSTATVDNAKPVAMTATLQVLSGSKSIADYTDNAYFLGTTGYRFVSIVADQILHTNAAMLSYTNATGTNNAKTPRDRSWRRTGFRFAVASWIMNEVNELYGTTKTVEDLSKLSAPTDIVSAYNAITGDLNTGYLSIDSTEKVHADTTTVAWYLCSNTPADTDAKTEYPRARDYVTWLDDSYTRTFTSKEADSTDAASALNSLSAFLTHDVLMSYQTYYKYTVSGGTIDEIPRTSATTQITCDGTSRFVADQEYRLGQVVENNGTYSIEYTAYVEMFNHIFTEVNTANASVEADTVYYYLEGNNYTAIKGSILGSFDSGRHYYVESFAEALPELYANGTNAFYGDIINKKMKDVDSSILTAMKEVDTETVTTPDASTQYYTYNGTDYTACALPLSAFAADTVYYVADTAKRALANNNAYAKITNSRDAVSGITADRILTEVKYKETVDAAYVPGKTYYTMSIVDNKSVLEKFTGNAFAANTTYYEVFSLQDLFDMIAAIKQMISTGCGIYGNASAAKVIYNIDENGGLITWDDWKQYAYTSDVSGSSSSSTTISDEMFDSIYPVGSIYTSITAKTVEELPYVFRKDSSGNDRYWVRIASGKCLWSATDSQVGVDIDEGLPTIPSGGSHTHDLKLCEYTGTSGWHPKDGNASKGIDKTMQLKGGLHTHTGGLYGKSDHVQPAAIGVTFWKRIAASNAVSVVFKDYDGTVYSGDHTVSTGDTVTPPTATDHTADNLTFDKWVTIDELGELTEFTSTTKVLQACTVWGNYKFDVTVASSSTTYGTVTGGGSYTVLGPSVVLVATPKAATTTDVYAFSHWQKNGSDWYTLTTDTTVVDGKTYYSLVDGAYTAVSGIAAGDAVPANTYYEKMTNPTTTVGYSEAAGNTFTAVFAAYKKMTIAVTFSPSGSGKVTGTGTFLPGDSVEIAVVPSSASYRFLYWDTDTNDTNPTKTVTIASNNTVTKTTYKANFILRRKITFVLNNGAFPDEFDYTLVDSTASFEEGKRYFTLADGVYTEVAEFTVGDPVGDEVTYYIGELKDLNSDNNILYVDNNSAFNTTTAVPTPVRDGYTFGGWYTNTACTTAYVQDTVIAANKTLYAKWTETAAE